MTAPPRPNTRRRSISCLLAAVCALAAPARGAPDAKFEVHLADGSRLVAQATSAKLPFRASFAEELNLPWAGIRQLKAEDKSFVVGFHNGDRLSGQLPEAGVRANTALGQILFPADQIRAITEIVVSDDRRENLALGKKVSGKDGASHGRGLAAHVTDGDLGTHAKPPSFGFDYTIDLCAGAERGVAIGEIAIHWGHYGDRYNGVRKGDGWARGSWPGEYVKSYSVEYRCAASEEWVELHRCNTRPADEESDGVLVDKRPTQRAGCSSEVTTTIDDLDLENVAELRIRAQGGHWIGLFELEVFGKQ